MLAGEIGGLNQNDERLAGILGVLNHVGVAIVISDNLEEAYIGIFHLFNHGSVVCESGESSIGTSNMCPLRVACLLKI